MKSRDRNSERQRPEQDEFQEPTAKALFAQQGLKAKRSFGQCFLADQNIARKIAEEATTPPGGTALEIGAGTGALTLPLLERAGRVIAIERDRDLAPLLAKSLSEHIDKGKLTVLEADAVTTDWKEVLGKGYWPHILVGNLPYQITGRLLEKAVELAQDIERAVFMVQKEVADRISAPHGTKDYGVLTIFVMSRFRLAKRLFVPASCFRPRPKIDSSVIVLEPRQEIPRLAPLFAPLVYGAFSQRRKTLRNALRGFAGVPLDKLEELSRQAGVSLEARAEAIPVDTYVSWAAHLEQAGLVAEPAPVSRSKS